MATHRRFFVSKLFLARARAAGGLLFANVVVSSYHSFTHGLNFVVNDVGTVFFFATAANEVGPLSSFRASRRRPAVCGDRRDGGSRAVYLVVSRPCRVGSSSG